MILKLQKIYLLFMHFELGVLLVWDDLINVWGLSSDISFVDASSLSSFSSSSAFEKNS